MKYLPKLDLNLQDFDFSCYPLIHILTSDSKTQTSELKGELGEGKGGRQDKFHTLKLCILQNVVLFQFVAESQGSSGGIVPGRLS